MQVDDQLHSKLEAARKDLLELSTRNRLLNTPRGGSRLRNIEIVDELSEAVFRVLVREQKALSFLPGRRSAPDEGHEADGAVRPQAHPEDNEADDHGVAKRHSDCCLQTTLTPEGLQKRLLGIYYDARTFQEEQGVNILYLAVGFLKWFEDKSSDRQFHAPLLLIPVVLERQNARTSFKLRYPEEEITTNLSLQAKLKADFGLDLPEVSEIEGPTPNAYFEQVANAVSSLPRWEVRPNEMVLGFFSFTKFLMYRDLDPANWPDGKQLDKHSTFTALLGDGFQPQPALCEEDEKIDSVIQPKDMLHVLDSDSSQAVAIEEVRRGGHVVIQGPPGTGKSQTICNLIATAVKEGKTVLFVAEKMAALEVVKRRLDNIGLGSICLELHSHKAKKSTVLEDLRRTLNPYRLTEADVQCHVNELLEVRDRLNYHAEVMHRLSHPSALTPYRVIGELVRLRAKGISSVDFTIENPQNWTAEEMRQRTGLLNDIAMHVGDMGTPAEHPWRGVTLATALPMDIQRLTERLPATIGRLGEFIAGIETLARQLNTHPATTANDAARLADFGHFLAAAPKMDRSHITDNIWLERRREVADLVKSGLTLSTSRAKLDGVVTESGWSTDVGTTRQDVATRGCKFFRFLNGAYRQARATMRTVLVNRPPRKLSAQLEVLDLLIACQKARSAIAEHNGMGLRAFGTFWHQEASEWCTLEAIEVWEASGSRADVPDNFRQVIAAVCDLEQVGILSGRVAENAAVILRDLRSLFDLVQLDLEAAFGVIDLKAVPLHAMKARLEAWLASPESITKWIACRVRREQLCLAGMAELADRLWDGRIQPREAIDRFHMAYFEAIMRKMAQENPNILAFDGQSHEHLRGRFKNLDSERINLARREVLVAHYESVQRGRVMDEFRIIQHEVQKKKKLLPIRQLLKRAGNSVQAIKPVFMMSPLSVAQYLAPGAIEFDLLLIDEASQVRPVDALGAVARAKQIVVVGDDKQLPPTRFFNAVLTDDSDDQADDAFQAGDPESILGLCKAQRMFERMLRWHYRSRHHSLIAVSNREFYNDKLYVVPSPQKKGESRFGLHFRHIANGVFDRGGSATNRVEAHAVAQAIMEHARTYPDLTLGVGAFSVAQRDAILDELERLRRDESELEEYFSPKQKEPFFVKNLENIQGDERDVIFISVGYGRDASGFMAMGFGPLSMDGGERRLNVLITRARQQCEVFSSITADDIDLTRAKGHGPRALKTFLSYAKTGILDVATLTGRGYDSPFEEAVARAISDHGYQVHAQVGVAGFFVDLAVIDPEKSGRYLVGIECDGASYHRSRSARDRDRLRQNVLEDHGWIIHRIWSTDWFYRPEEQLRKVLAAIDLAKVKTTEQDREASVAPDKIDASNRGMAIERPEPADNDPSDLEWLLTKELEPAMS